MKTGLAAASFAPGLVAGPVKANVTSMASQFVAGATPSDLVKRFKANAAAGIATTIDLLGETVVSQSEADVFLQRNIDVLDTVAKAIGSGSEPCFSDMGPKGPLPRLNLSVKVSALTPEVHPADPQRSVLALKDRLRPILRRASEIGAFINFDMESYGLKDLTLSLFRSILAEEEFRTGPAIGIAMQAYLRDCERDLRDLIAWARSAKRPIVVRLVKGAYWDYETTLAGQRGWPVPVWAEKSESDANYEKLSVLLLQNADIAAPAFASHNVRSCAHAIAQADRLGIDPRIYEFQALYGMADELKSALVSSGRRVREYCPVGDLLPGMAYLVRRLLENTSNEGFLRAKRCRRRLPAMGAAAQSRGDAGLPGGRPRRRSPPLTPAVAAFRNAPNTDFNLDGEPCARMRSALESVAKGLGRKHPIVIGGKEDFRPPDDRLHQSGQAFPGYRPLGPRHGRGRGRRGRRGARAGVRPAWAARTLSDRAAILERAADLMEARRFELSALEVLEAAKPWIEADADISEAVDFCRYYASEIRELDRPPRHAGRARRARHPASGRPAGLGVAIAPWNFPLAILCGLTTAHPRRGKRRHHEARRADHRDRGRAPWISSPRRACLRAS